MTKEQRAYNGERLLSNWCQENQAATCKRVKLDCCLIPHTKLTQNRLKILDHKNLEEHIGVNLTDQHFFFFFLVALTPKAKEK